MIEILHQIVERACTLSQHLEGRLPSETIQTEPDWIEAKLEQWKKNTAGGDTVKFEKYLNWNGLDITNAKEILSPAEFEARSTLPDWAETLKLALETAASTGMDEYTPDYFDPDLPIPFQEFLVPFIELARHRLKTRLGDSRHLLGPKAQASLERYLLLTLSRLSCQALMTEFKV